MSDLYIFNNALKDLLSLRRVVVALFLIAIPVVFVFFWRNLPKHEDTLAPDALYDLMSSLLVFGFIQILLSVVFSTSVISQEMESKTIGYLLTRPLPRWRLLLVKFIPVLLVTTFIACLAAVLLSLAIYGADGLKQASLHQDLMLLPVGSLVFGSLFLLIATLLNRPLIWGLIYGFGWEIAIASFSNLLPGTFNRLFIVSYFRALAPHLAPTGEEGGIMALLGTPSVTPIPIWLSWTVLISIIVLCMAGSLFAFSTREYVPRDTAE